MILKMSTNHDQHGRRKKTVRAKKKKHVGWTKFQRVQHAEAKTRKEKNNDTLREYLAKMPEWAKEDDTYKKEVSSNYTVAIAYNKGAYQVIPKKEVKDIGR